MTPPRRPTWFSRKPSSTEQGRDAASCNRVAVEQGVSLLRHTSVFHCHRAAARRVDQAATSRTGSAVQQRTCQHGAPRPLSSGRCRPRHISARRFRSRPCHRSSARPTRQNPKSPEAKRSHALRYSQRDLRLRSGSKTVAAGHGSVWRRVQVFDLLARPESFELPTPWFVARYSIQLSYGRTGKGAHPTIVPKVSPPADPSDSPGRSCARRCHSRGAGPARRRRTSVKSPGRVSLGGRSPCRHAVTY